MADWFTAGEAVNPATDAILADSGAIGPGTYQFDVVLSANVSVDVSFEHRNVANSVTLHSHVLYFGLNDKGQWYFNVTVGGGERVRLRVVSGVVGKVSGSIIRQS